MRVTAIVLITLALVCQGGDAFGQDLEGQETQGNAVPFPFHLDGEQAPRWVLVQVMMSQAHVMSHSQETRDAFMEHIGLPPDEKVSTAFWRAIDRWGEVHYGPFGPHAIVDKDSRTEIGYSPMAAGKSVRAEGVAIARRAGAVYGQLVRELERAGSSIEIIERHLQETVARSTSIDSDEPFDSGSTLMMRDRAFEESLREEIE